VNRVTSGSGAVGVLSVARSRLLSLSPPAARLLEGAPADAKALGVRREKPQRPFRCLDSQYRRELVRVYLTNVEGICRRFVEEKRERLARLREDPASFRAFWCVATPHGQTPYPL
jgi:hypothetical protein